MLMSLTSAAAAACRIEQSRCDGDGNSHRIRGTLLGLDRIYHYRQGTMIGPIQCRPFTVNRTPDWNDAVTPLRPEAQVPVTGPLLAEATRKRAGQSCESDDLRE